MDAITIMTDRTATLDSTRPSHSTHRLWWPPKQLQLRHEEAILDTITWPVNTRSIFQHAHGVRAHSRDFKTTILLNTVLANCCEHLMWHKLLGIGMVGQIWDIITGNLHFQRLSFTQNVFYFKTNKNNVVED